MLEKAVGFIKSLGAGNKNKYTGSYSGVKFFIVDSATLSGGHRVVRHEYPLRDEGYSENMGRLMRSWSINALVIGDDHIDKRDALIAAMEAPEPAELIHPYYGSEFVQVESWTCTDSENHGGVSYFVINYTEATKEESPIVADNGLVLLAEAKSSFIDGLIDNFMAAWDIVNAGIELAESVIEFTENIVNGITSVIRGLSGGGKLSGLLSHVMSLKTSIKALINSPKLLAQELTGLLSSFGSSGNKNAKQALYSVITSVRKNQDTSTSNNDVSGRTVTSNTLQQAVETLIISVAVAEIADIVLNETHQTVKQSNQAQSEQTEINGTQTETLEDCEIIMGEISNQLTDIMIKTGDSLWYSSSRHCNSLRQVFITQMQLLLSLLPDAERITLKCTEPALVALYRETGNSKAVRRFCARNGVYHPSFAVGGRIYEVIDNAK